MISLNSKTVVKNSLATMFELKSYLEIIGEINKPDFKATDEFKKKFNGYYRVRQRNEAWYQKYYELMEKQKSDNRTFKELLYEMYNIKQKNGRQYVEVSFVSKLIAAVDPTKPIWDKYVLQNTGKQRAWEQLNNAPLKERMDAAVQIYNEIEKEYNDFLSTPDGKACIAEFDKIFSADEYYNITAVKKLDYWLWSGR